MNIFHPQTYLHKQHHVIDFVTVVYEALYKRPIR